jgi:hypothetical protein
MGTDPADAHGKPALLLTIDFTPPASDRTWAYVEVWGKRSDDGVWRILVKTAKSGTQVAIEQLPAAGITLDVLLIDRDVNGKDADGNIETDPDAPPAGSATVSVSIPAPALGSAGQEYATW